MSVNARGKLWAGGLAGIGSSAVALYTLAASLGAHVALVAVMAWAPAPQPEARARYIDVDAFLFEPAPLPPVEPTLAPLSKHGPPRARPRAPHGHAKTLAPVPLAASATPLAAAAPPELVAEAAPGLPPPPPAAPEPAPGRAVHARIYAEGDADRAPELLGEPRPVYPASALRQGAEGDVVLALVVDAEGKVSDARVTRRAGLGFDAAALAAARRLRFRPGVVGGRSVPVRVSWTCHFRLTN